MIVDDLIRELQTYPQDWPVLLGVKGVYARAIEVEIKSDETAACVLIRASE